MTMSCPLRAAILFFAVSSSGSVAPLAGQAVKPAPATASAAAPAKEAPAAPVASTDVTVASAQLWIGRALILRGFYGGNELAYDAEGHIKGSPKPVDWTMAGVALDNVTRKAPGELELAGVRVAIRYNPGAAAFERHNQNADKIHILLTTGDSPEAVQTAMTRVFSIGIDHPLQLSMPPYWSHYFNPALPWSTDALSNVTILGASGKVPATLVQPAVETRFTVTYPLAARQDKVNGTVEVSLVVDADGIPRRIVIKRPLGYGIDARMAESIMKLRFHPGLLDGKPVAVQSFVSQTFDSVTAATVVN